MKDVVLPRRIDILLSKIVAFCVSSVLAFVRGGIEGGLVFGLIGLLVGTILSIVEFYAPNSSSRVTPLSIFNLFSVGFGTLGFIVASLCELHDELESRLIFNNLYNRVSSFLDNRQHVALRRRQLADEYPNVPDTALS